MLLFIKPPTTTTTHHDITSGVGVNVYGNLTPTLWGKETVSDRPSVQENSL